VVERVEMTFLEEAQGTEVVSVGETHLYTAGRKHLWDESLAYFYESPIFGTGYRTFGKLTGLDTHNEYFKVLAEGGIIGIFIYLWLYFLALRSGWRLYRNADEELLKAFGFGFVCAVVGSIVVNFFGDRWSYLQIGGLYWIFWALVDQENSKLKTIKTADA
jgi:O-antigen ligase